MNSRRWIVMVILVVIVGGAVTLYALPAIARRVAVARIQGATGRPTAIDAIELALLSGRATVHGLRIAERDGTTPFADFPRIDLRLSLASLLLGHVWVRELALTDSTIRIVRLPNNELNVSDLLGKSGSTEKRVDITVDHFRVKGGTVTLQDQAVPGAPLWKSERMTIDARNVSTRRDDGTAVATSVTAGAPVRIEVSKLRLHPIHLAATATVEGLDLTPAQVYFPPNAEVRIDRGRMSTTVALTLDAQAGIHADASGHVDDVVVVSAGGDILARVPTLTAQLSGFGLRDQSFQVQRLVTNGTISVRDPTAKGRPAFKQSTVRANVADLTWPATTPGLVDVEATIPGGGALALAGTVRPPPAATQLSLRITSLNLAPWAQFFPLNAMVTGLASADLRIDEPFGAGIPAHIQGTAALAHLGVADARQQVLGAARVELSGLELHWPERLIVRRLVVSAPRAIVERDAAGNFPLNNLVRRDASAKVSAPPALRVSVGEIGVRDGALAWRDASVAPAARLNVGAIDAAVTGGGWPLAGPLNVRVGLRPPGGGHVRVIGRVGIDPVSADVRVITKAAELAPYQPYLQTAARVSGAADLDLAVVVPSLGDRRAMAHGTATLARVDVRDGQRTILRAERATASELDVAWPERVAMGRLALARPWLLLERDDKGALALRALAPRPDGEKTGEPASEELAFTVARLTIEDGGLRVVDRAISPAFAVDLDSGTLRMEGLSTVAAPPAKLDLTARVGGNANLALRGTIGALGGPLKLDVTGELREFAVPRANSYLVNQAGWKSREGRMTAKLRARIDGDALSAKSDIRVSQLQLVRASAEDTAQHRIGLPLGTLTALMKDKRGDITVSVPVGGRLSDPRFDLRETIWRAVRTVAVNAITLPVSWIGRVHLSADSKIQRIEVDPLPFEPGTAELTPEGRTRVTRVTAFLEQLPEIRLALTPVVSSRDVAEIKRRDTRGSADSAALPRAAVMEHPIPASVVPDLAKRRLETVRTAFKQAGIDSTRFTETTVAERTTAETQIELEILEPEGERPSKVRQVLHRLGAPLKDRVDD
jgi:uncharacterized protein involved in outer membrane biogenesis